MPTLSDNARPLMPPRWTTPVRNLVPLAVGLSFALGLHVLFGSIDQAFYAKLCVDIAIAIILAVSLNMVNGFTGQFSMGHAGFMAIGAYAAAAITYYGSVKLFGTPNPFASGEPTAGILSWGRGFDRLPEAGLPILGGGDLLFIAACLVGGLVAAGAGWVVGLPSLRLRGDYLAIVTLGFGEIVRVLLQSSKEQVRVNGSVTHEYRVGEVASDPTTGDTLAILQQGTGRRFEFGPGDRLITNSDTGQQLFIDSSPGLDYIREASPLDLAPHLGEALGFTGLGRYTSMFWVWLGVAITLIVAFRLKYSSAGRAFLSIREDEVAAEAMGIHTTRYKVRAFVLASFFAGLAGALFAHQNGSVDAQTFGFIRSFDVIIMIVLGGLGSISGAILAAALLTVLPELLRQPPTLLSIPGGIVVAVTLGLIAVLAQRRLRTLVATLGALGLWELAHIASTWGTVPGMVTENGVTREATVPAPALVDAVPQLPLWLVAVLALGGAAAAATFWRARRGLAAFLAVLVFVVWHVLATGVWKNVNPGEYRMILFSLALILMMILRPQGLLGIHELWETHAVKSLWARLVPRPAVADAKIPTTAPPKTGNEPGGDA